MMSRIRTIVAQSLKEVYGEELPKDVDFDVLVPPKPEFGDYSVNVAMVLAKRLHEKPIEIATEIAEKMSDQAEFERVEVVVPGYVNIFLKKDVFEQIVKDILKKRDAYGKNTLFEDKKVLIEYTDPNPFKVFHIGHLMTNAIGESIARLYECAGAQVERCNYQGDVGMHVAKALWGALQIESEIPNKKESGEIFAEFFGKAYVIGAKAYEEDREIQQEIQNINKQVYDRNNDHINELYDIGRKKTLEHFEELYKLLGTKFDHYFFESHTASFGRDLVQEGLKKGILEESKGAIIYPGEKRGLHTRVFLSAAGLPTYEAKDLGLIQEKRQTVNGFDKSISITANEQNRYFEVVLAVARELLGEAAQKTQHIGHGMMRLSTGKMGSRKGNVISGESLLKDAVQGAKEKVQSKDITPEMREKISQAIGVGAVKYAILKQSIGKDIVYDSKQSLSLEGNSGPYLQYALIRAKSVLAKAGTWNSEEAYRMDDGGREVENLLMRFPDIVEMAVVEESPHKVADHLFSLAQAFNAFYAKNPILNSEEYAPYRITLTMAVAIVLEKGLDLLGIGVPEKM